MAVMAVFETGLATRRSAPTWIGGLWPVWRSQPGFVSAADAAARPVTVASPANITTGANFRARNAQPETPQHRLVTSPSSGRELKARALFSAATGSGRAVFRNWTKAVGSVASRFRELDSGHAGCGGSSRDASAMSSLARRDVPEMTVSRDNRGVQERSTDATTADSPVVPCSASAADPLAARTMVPALRRLCTPDVLARPTTRRMPKQNPTAGLLPARAAARRS